MDQEIISARNLALANLLDIIPLILNTNDGVSPAIMRMYERNVAVLNGFDHENGIEHQRENNIEE